LSLLAQSQVLASSRIHRCGILVYLHASFSLEYSAAAPTPRPLQAHRAPSPGALVPNAGNAAAAAPERQCRPPSPIVQSSRSSSCQGAIAELALPQPWTPSGHPSPISSRPHPLAAAPSYSWWLSLLPWMLAVLPSLVLTSAPCVGWPVAPALGLSSATSNSSLPARILLIGPAQIILMPGRGTTATSMKPLRVVPSMCSMKYRSELRPESAQPWPCCRPQ
jgi:hypothetical protein